MTKREICEEAIATFINEKSTSRDIELARTQDEQGHMSRDQYLKDVVDFGVNFSKHDLAIDPVGTSSVNRKQNKQEQFKLAQEQYKLKQEKEEKSK